MKITLNRIDDAYNFEAINEDGKTAYTDGSPDIGGRNNGMRPMQLFLSSLGSCSAIDVIFILQKQKEPLEHITVEVQGERHENRTPASFRKIHVHYKVTGNLDPKKVRRAIDLSMEKYCSVTDMLKDDIEITNSFEIL